MKDKVRFNFSYYVVVVYNYFLDYLMKILEKLSPIPPFNFLYIKVAGMYNLKVYKSVSNGLVTLAKISKINMKIRAVENERLYTKYIFTVMGKLPEKWKERFLNIIEEITQRTDVYINEGKDPKTIEVLMPRGQRN